MEENLQCVWVEHEELIYYPGWYLLLVILSQPKSLTDKKIKCKTLLCSKPLKDTKIK